MEAINDSNETEKYNYKISKEEFLPIWKKNNGSPAKTAETIRKALKMPYTKQAAQQMAKRLKAEETKEKEELIKEAKQVLKEAVRSKDEKIRVRTAMQILKNLKKFT